MGAPSLSLVLRSTEFRLPPQDRWSKRVGFGARLRNARLAAGLTLTQLAEGITSTAYVSRIEASERRPSRELLADLAGRMGQTVDDLVGGDAWAHEGLRFELAHADLLLGSGRYDEATRVARDLADVAAGIGADDIADAARIVHATTLTAQGFSRPALRLALSLTEGPLGLPAMVAAARAHLDLHEFAEAIEIGQRIGVRLAAKDRLSIPEGVDVAITVCESYRAIGRDSAAERVACLALRHLPADVRAQVAAGEEPVFRPRTVSYRSFGQAIRNTERAVAAMQFDSVCAGIDELRDHTSTIVGEDLAWTRTW